MEYKTKAQQAKEARHARVIAAFKEATAKFGQFSPTKRAEVVAKYEQEYPDGVTTLIGIIKILQSNGLWQPRPHRQYFKK